MKKNIYKIIGSIVKLSLFVTLAFYVIIFILLLLFKEGTTLKNPKQYDKASSIIKSQEKISHFPKKIPQSAQHIKMYCYTSDFNGEIFLLEFKADVSYIQKEQKSHKFINDDTEIGQKQKLYHFYSGGGIKSDGYTFYVIDDEENRQCFNEYFPYYSGIGIKDNDYILYYFFYPGD